MAFCQCEYCKKICNMQGHKLCPECSKELDGIYKKIRKHMYMTGGRVTAAKIVEELNVPEQAVDYLIRDNRLVLDRGAENMGKCKICGNSTDGDILCRECRKKFADGIQKYQKDRVQQKESVKTDKMHYSASVHPLKRKRDD